MELLDQYIELKNKLHKYFGYVEDWVVIPMDDQRDFYWHLTGEKHGDVVKYAIAKENVFDGTEDDGYESEIYTQRFLPKWVYRGLEYTMVCVNTRVDGNKFLMIFDNAKEIKTTDE